MPGRKRDLPDVIKKFLAAMTSDTPPFDPSALRPEFRDERFWTRETARFLAFAESLISRRRWRGSYGAPPAGGQEPHDYVMRSVALILEGHRRCPPDVEPVPFVFGVIRSLVAHDADNLENRQQHSYLDMTADDAGHGTTAEREFADRSGPAAEELLTADDLARDFLSELPEDYRPYVELLISGVCSGAAECAEKLGMSVADIRLMDKAIRRRRRLWKGAPPK